MTPTDEKDFQMMAKTALAHIKDGMERTGGSMPVFMVRNPDGKVEKISLPKELGKLMNSGDAKNMLFDGMRQIVKHKGITATCFATEAWMGETTQAGRLVSPKEFDAATRQRGFQAAVDRGWVIRRECVVVVLQTEEVMRSISQQFERDEEAQEIRWIGEPVTHTTPQSHFKGRQKMYGDLREENLS
ncbi:MAG TPA: hypothetical protein VGG62_12165 [Terracidiphilus sp.]|jgi:hypothetical protein